MAITLVTGTGQTTSVPTVTPLMPAAGSFAYSKDDPGEAVYSNIAGALDQPNSIRYAVSKVSDVFKSTPVDPAGGQRVDGFSVLIQVNEAWKVYDNADSSVVPYYLPVSAHMVLKFPVDANIDATAIAALVARLDGAAHRNAAHSLATALSPLLHGVCAP